MTTLQFKKSIDPSPLRLRFLLIPLALTWFAFSPTSFSQLPSPAPDGGYPNGNTAEGDSALFSLTSGSDNTAVGAGALFSNTDGSDNTANGFQSLNSNTDGSENTANGVNALFFNTTANDNTATGFEALYSNTTGADNTATGFEALYSNTTGADNTANGVNALLNNTTGSQNTANGVGTLKQNTTGHANTANGYRALYINTTGNANTANGIQSLYSNTTGSQNTAEGLNALANNTIGSNNIALGVSAGLNLTAGSNNIDIGAPGVAGESGVIRIGKSPTATGTFIAGIAGKTVASGVGVIVNANGQLGTVLSSARFKTAIKPMDKASEAILSLQPVTFRYKQELDPDGVPQFGLVAEQVEKVNPDLVVRDEDGKVNTVRYEAVNAMLLNEFLKEHRTVAELKDLTQKQQAMIAQQQKQIEALTATVQKVSEKIDLDKTAPQLVVDRR